MTQVETKNGRDGKKSKIFSSGELKNTKSLQQQSKPSDKQHATNTSASKSMRRTLEMWKAALGGNIFALGMVSFFTDLSSEMIYPLLPMFFTGLVPAAMVAVYIGLMDGIAEMVSSLLKIYSGRLSDLTGKRKKLILTGYGISALFRPLLSLVFAGWQVVVLRFADRIGKGIRTSPRDALISHSAPENVRGLAYSFHRMMDHTGAVLGPLAAGVFLYILCGASDIWQRGINAVATPDEMAAMRWLFAFALLPGIAAALFIIFKVREIPAGKADAAGKKAEAGEKKIKLPGRFYLYLLSVTLFTLGNSSDLFLIYFVQSKFKLGFGYLILMWTILHVSKIFFSMPGGILSDKLGRRRAIIAGWLVYILVYISFPFASTLAVNILLITVYGLYYGMTEGAERALVADCIRPEQHGKAFGLYHGAVGLASLPASLVFGLLWSVLGAQTAFMIGAGFAVAGTVTLSVSSPPQRGS